MIKTRARSMKAVAVAAIGVLLAGVSATAAYAGGEANSPGYWQDLYPNVGTCVKIDPPGATNSYGHLSDGGTSVVLNANQALLVVKSGDEDTGDGPGNKVIVDPVAGTHYFSPLNHGGNVGAVSHWIVCPYKAPVDTEVTPNAPTVEPICGPNNDTVTIPTTEGVNYSDTGWAGGTRTITATAKDGYKLIGTTSWTFTDEDVACPVELTEVTPNAPTVEPICGPNNDTVTIPTTEGVNYSDTGWAGGTRTITATAKDGYKLIGTTSWTFTDEDVACPVELTEVTPNAPTVEPICGPNNDTVTIPTTEGVNYSDTGWAGGTRTITATAKDGYKLIGTTSWTFTDEDVACPVELTEVTPNAPTVEPICGPNNDTVTIPTTEGVNYSDTGWAGGTRTITATAKDGYKLIGTTSWTFTDEDVACPIEITAVAAVVVDPPVCGPNNDVVTVPENTAGVTYSDTGWKEGTRTITAAANTGYVLKGQSSWTFTDASTLCPVTTVPPTVTPVCFPHNDTVTIPEVTGVIYSDTDWVGDSRTITATAAAGYTLVGDTSWTFIDIPGAGCPADNGVLRPR